MICARGKLFRAGSFAAAAAVVAIVGSARFNGEAWRGSGSRQAAHAKSAHARVACPVCHAGAERPSGSVCLDCHPPGKTAGDRLRVVERFSADRENSVARTVFRSKRRNIHEAHLRPGVSILYTAADERRQVIPRVEVGDAAAHSEVYEDAAAGALPADARTHLMDCVDCHNRTAHAFDAPSRALDRVLSDDTLSPSLPFIKRAGLELLLGRYAGRAEVLAGIRAGLARFYREREPETWEKRRAEIGGAAEVLAGIYQADWADYPDNLGHTRFPGCFRCHDGRHTSADGAVIPSDCRVCHELFGDR